jgi:hypothetical protein
MSIPQFTASKIGEDRLMLFCQDKVLEFPRKGYNVTLQIGEEYYIGHEIQDSCAGCNVSKIQIDQASNWDIPVEDDSPAKVILWGIDLHTEMWKTERKPEEE